MEVWKEIKGTDGRYAVSSSGRVWSNFTKKVLKTYVNSAGYVLIRIEINGEKKNWQVHRLVAEAFIPNEQNKPQVNHIDAVRTNNNVENLEWCTPSENTRHSFKLGTSKRYAHHERPVRRSDGKVYPSLCAAARELGVPYSYVRDVCSGKQKSTRGYGFERIGGDLQ